MALDRYLVFLFLIDLVWEDCCVAQILLSKFKFSLHLGDETIFDSGLCSLQLFLYYRKLS